MIFSAVCGENQFNQSLFFPGKKSQKRIQDEEHQEIFLEIPQDLRENPERL